MKRVRLSKAEKRLLRWLADGFVGRPEDMPSDVYISAVRGLVEHGFVRAKFLTNGKVARVV